MGDEINETPEGTIRCPTTSPDSILELSISGTRVLRRFVQPDGEPHEHRSQWMLISATATRTYYNWPSLREWFQRHGFNEEVLREQEGTEKEVKRAWKKKLRR